MGGREFHGIRAATSKLRSPKPVRDLGTDNRERHGSAERKSLVIGVERITEIDRGKVVEAFEGKQMDFERYTVLYWKPMKFFEDWSDMIILRSKC